ncbi:hypothetical protein N9J64_00365 [bacterium]|nr:hypothetical protein [bacterium]
MANTEIRRTTGSTPTNAEKFTVSLWFKVCQVGSSVGLFGWRENSNSGNNNLFIRINGNGNFQIYFTSNNGNDNHLTLLTNRLFRDCNSWYHAVISVDSSQSTSSDRAKLYINGIQETSFSSASYPASGRTFFSNDTQINFGKTRSTGDTDTYFSGLQSHIHFTDGTAYDASAFGETDATTGEWVGKTSPSVTYGNNGFFILKDGNGITDQSGEGNDFTLGSGTLTDLKDNPDNVFATYNALSNTGVTLTQGNLTGAYSTNDANIRSTLGVSTGKWYWETKFTTGSGCVVGVCNEDVTQTTDRAGSVGFYGIQNANATYAYYRQNGSTGETSNYPNPVQGNIVNFALDLDNSKIYIGINGVYKNQAGTTSDLANGTNPFFSSIASSVWFPILEYRGSGVTTDSNFGNGFFGTTAITTNSGNGYSGAEGSSKFNYTVPAGYSALSTKGLNL